jgi:broad specificity phosphatase PhoE
VIVVRHAEKISGSDERLSDAGHARARLAAMLKDARVSAIYSTDTERTRDTVKPSPTS